MNTEVFVAALQTAILIGFFRSTPFVCCFSSASSVGAMKRALVLGTYATVGFALIQTGHARILAWVAGAFAYYFALVSWIYDLPRSDLCQRRRWPTVFAILAALTLLVPGLLVPADVKPAFLVLGWEVLLSSYSYLRESARHSATPSTLKQCAFFILVNPTCVFAERGHRKARADVHYPSLLRIVAGLVAVGVSQTIAQPIYHSLRDTPGMAAAVGFPFVRIAGEYAAHSGLAGARIGMMRQLGYSVPECYRRPFLARDPVDFWRRWNTYFGAWLARYVMAPATRALRARVPHPVGALVCVLVTFAVSGALHELFAVASGASQLRFLTFFVAAGVAASCWIVGERGTRRLPSRVASAASRVLLLCLLVGASRVWG